MGSERLPRVVVLGSFVHAHWWSVPRLPGAGESCLADAVHSELGGKGLNVAVETFELSFSRPQTTLAVTRGAARLMIDLGFAPLLEVRLPNGRRADVMALGPKGDLLIVEVKSGLEDFRIDRKWPEYGPYCDAFYFAVAPHFPDGILPEEPGMIVADGFGGAVIREAPVAPLAPARRKALTLAFARLGAMRACGVVTGAKPCRTGASAGAAPSRDGSCRSRSSIGGVQWLSICPRSKK